MMMIMMMMITMMMMIMMMMMKEFLIVLTMSLYLFFIIIHLVAIGPSPAFPVTQILNRRKRQICLIIFEEISLTCINQKEK